MRPCSCGWRSSRGRLIGFTAALPGLPVPMEELPTEDLQQVAEAFCERHFPELAAEGGEVMAQVRSDAQATSVTWQFGIDPFGHVVGWEESYE